jgi:hypothetical protein
MSRRLEEATEEALLTGGRAGRQAIEDAGFSSELKERLLSRITSARAQSIVQDADPTANPAIPDAAGAGTRAIASAVPWMGEEQPADAVLRMLTDAHKPLKPGLRGPARIPSPTSGDREPVIVDMRLRRAPAVSPGQKASLARDRASAYSGLGMKDDKAGEKGLNKEEKEAMKKEFRERFTPGARAMPNTISGLAALANERCAVSCYETCENSDANDINDIHRIEDAIARGQFKVSDISWSSPNHAKMMTC